MTNRSETFGHLLKGAINSIAAYEGKTAPAIEEELGAEINLTGDSIQRYKAGYLPPEPRTVAAFAEAGVQRGFLARAWLTRFSACTQHRAIFRRQRLKLRGRRSSERPCFYRSATSVESGISRRGAVDIIVHRFV
jgi:hypothetical protein